MRSRSAQKNTLYRGVFPTLPSRLPHQEIVFGSNERIKKISLPAQKQENPLPDYLVDTHRVNSQLIQEFFPNAIKR